MELEPRRTLIATQPFAKPKVGEQLYDTKIELEIQGENERGYYRFYRRGVFVVTTYRYQPTRRARKTFQAERPG